MIHYVSYHPRGRKFNLDEAEILQQPHRTQRRFKRPDTIQTNQSTNTSNVITCTVGSRETVQLDKKDANEIVEIYTNEAK